VAKYDVNQHLIATWSIITISHSLNK